MLDKIYKFKWVRKKVKWNDGSLKCSRCEYVFKVGDYAYMYYNRYLGIISKVYCSECKKEVR